MKFRKIKKQLKIKYLKDVSKLVFSFFSFFFCIIALSEGSASENDLKLCQLSIVNNENRRAKLLLKLIVRLLIKRWV